MFWEGLEDAFSRAAALDFDAVEIFAPDAASLEPVAIRQLMTAYGVGVAAVGTGAGWVKHRLHLVHPDEQVRLRARGFLLEMVNAGGALGAPAILGSMQGRVEGGVTRDQALKWLAEALWEADAAAAAHGTFFLFEPLNRYESNLFNRQLDAVAFLEKSGFGHVRILADLFHMNIEESDPAATIRGLGSHLGHVHFADSNRHAVGFGHSRMVEILSALREVHYQGYLSAEVFPFPDSQSAAVKTIQSFRALAG